MEVVALYDDHYTSALHTGHVCSMQTMSTIIKEQAHNTYMQSIIAIIMQYTNAEHILIESQIPCIPTAV